MDSYIKILKYMGKSAGFSYEDTERFSVSIVTPNGERSVDGWMSEGFGMGSLQTAMETAAPWSHLLGFEIRIAERKHISSEYEDVYEDEK